ncbi:MAG: hypothetical protein RBU37_22660, partial [Myxococcota bacterium]|nr:hypothetical protein [Myxococcota bacterium]
QQETTIRVRECAPADAALWMDGILLRPLPATPDGASQEGIAYRVPTGARRLELRRAGFFSHRRDILLSEERSYRLSVDLVRDLSSFFSPPRTSLRGPQTSLGTQAPPSTPGSEGNSSSPRSDGSHQEGTPSSDALTSERCPSVSEADSISGLRVGSESERMQDYVRP